MKTLLGRLVRHWHHHRRIREMRVALASLDSRTLRDLGIDRSEIASYVEEWAGRVEPDRRHRFSTPT